MRIVVVEDEERIRNGIARLLHKLSSTYQVVGQCENGAQGMAAIRQWRPDLVITDIRMPEMSGLDMLERLKNEGIAPRTVILSGHSDFEFARQALHIGNVIQYLLKPITIDDLKQVLLDVEKQNLIGSEFDFEQIPLHLQEWFGFNPALEFQAASVYLGRQYPDFAAEVKRRLHCALEKDGGVSGFVMAEFRDQLEIDILLQIHSSACSVRQLRDSLIDQLRFLNLSDLVMTWTSLPQLTAWKEKLSEARSIRSWSLVFGNYAHFDLQAVRGQACGTLHYPAEWEAKMKEAVSSGDPNKIRQLAEQFADYCTKAAADPQSTVETCVRFAAYMLYIAGVMRGDISAFKDRNGILQRLASVQTPNELRIALAEAADHIAAEIEGAPHSYSFVIHKSLKIIQEQYRNGITLEELAQSFHITPEYLSSLFQKELGVSFTAYLKELRIKKAKELLMNERLKAFEVASRVGYSDAKYFSRVFKEATGLTPGEFQKLH